ncbi:uncharacterized protein F4812DRAFT_432784 [Daldinia caldariorum]|uniref:uncharacterized protein n=1 Tax=Daldinia caldariorum TaxID=326644 RepID=UPI00200780CA|nr:uncharacterized protein F4812DRAFT_432784 [Daldinia caldariorum]KAI1466782.1 hypothetical protein F4812DRAFT_432784 [Daldinia caldariorum]
MASRKVSALKFVGTVSLGLLTGTSYTLSALALPSLLELPSAASASKALRTLASAASTHLTSLAGLSGSAFLLAFALSPRGFRHPYLLYTSVFCLGTRLSDYVTPSLFGAPPVSSSGGSSASASAAAAQRRQARRDRKAAARRGMEASYEDLGGSGSHSDGTVSGEELDDEHEHEVNGEDVRREAEYFARNQLVQTALAGVGFAMAVVGIWGDGVVSVSETLVLEL